MSGIYWLASYPKSGNTWLRVFLENYRSNNDEPANINELSGGGTAFFRENFNNWLGADSSCFSWTQIEHYRPLVYEEMASESNEPLFLKVHDAYSYNLDNQPIFSKKATAGVIYLIRNPFDVAVSLAHHLDKTIDEAIEVMGRHDFALVENRDVRRLPQRLLSWSEHVLSWLDEPGLNVLVVSYEDMHRNPIEAFTNIVRYSGLEIDADRIAGATELSSFNKLKAQESDYGFAEKSPTARSFFREGRSGSWRDSLTDPQIAKIAKEHGDVMRRVGYLTADNEFLC